MCDRTQEFLSLCGAGSLSGSGSSSSLHSSSSTKRLSSAPGSGSSKGKNNVFGEAAAEIARGVHKTSAMLTKLTNLVRKQGLYDDPTEEINNLIFRIKQDLDELNTKCDSAQQYIDSSKRGNSGFLAALSGGESQTQSSQHNGKVVSQLKSDLLNTTKDFKQVLEMRSSRMKDQQQRKVELIGKNTGISALASLQHSVSASSSGNAGDAASSSSSGALVKRNNGANSSSGALVRKALPSPYATDPDDLYGASSVNRRSFLDDNQQQQQLLLEPIQNVEYYDAREQAVTEVEKTIGELGTLFKRLATMLQEQQELVERIDEDVENAVTDTNNAKNALVKALESASSNRGMYMKLGGIMAIFFLIFVLFLM